MGSLNLDRLDSVQIIDSDGHELDIAADGSLVISATDLDIRDLTHVSDSVKLGDGTSLLTSTTVGADIGLDVYVLNTELDVDINSVSYSGNFSVDIAAQSLGDVAVTLAGETVTVDGSIQIDDGTDTLAINADGSINVNLTDDSIADDAADSGNPFKVGSRASFGAALSALSATNDRADLLSDEYRRIYINDAPAVGWTAAAVAVSTTAVQLDASKQSGRTRALVQNLGSTDIAVGPTNAVTFASGIVISKKSNIFLELGEQLNLYAIGDTGASSEDVRIGQFG